MPQQNNKTLRLFAKPSENVMMNVISVMNPDDIVRKARFFSHGMYKLINEKYRDEVFVVSTYEKKVKKTPEFKSSPNDHVTSCKKLSGGLTNTTLFFTTPRGAFVARNPGLKTDGYINRDAEAKNVQIASDAGINAHVEYNESSGIQVTEFLKNPLPMNAERLKAFHNIDAVTNALKQIHQCGKKFANDVDVFARNKQFYRIVLNNHATLPPDYQKVAIQMEKLEELFTTLHIKNVPCHVDTTPGNFILSEGKMRIIDWEYSGNCDPLWDLSYLSMEAEFDHQQDVEMFKAYFGSWDAATWNRFILYKPVVEYFVALWAQVQISNGNVVDDPSININMEINRFANCKRLLESDEFKKAFDELALPSLAMKKK